MSEISVPQAASQTPVDLSTCAQEPIHIPGAIQPHGVLLALSAPGLVVTQVSSNCAMAFGLPPENVLGRPLSDLLDPDVVNDIREALRTHNARHVNPMPVFLHRDGIESVWNGIIHTSGNVLILELEPIVGDVGAQENANQLFVRALQSVERATTQTQLFQTAVQQVRAITGFDRVLIYRFDHDWHGEVLAEAQKAGLSQSFLGQHFPASDIPEQARRLYTLNWIRLIADTTYKPAPLVPAMDPATGKPLDLSFATLRSVSPIHIEYLTNMGLQASMSLSLVIDGRLWGLISCHHSSPRFVPYDVRAACETLARFFSLRVGAITRAEAAERRAEKIASFTPMVERIRQHPDWQAAIAGLSDELRRLFDAGGLALVTEGKTIVKGETPTPEQVEGLVQWIGGRRDENGLFLSSELPLAYEAARVFKDTASGVLAVPLSSAPRPMLLFFRPEVLKTVHWAGDPQKPVTLGPHGPRLHPRGSFALWSQTVQLTSTPWSPSELEAANELRQVLTGLLARRAEELARFNAVLRRSNDELELFSTLASHDLREPLRGIRNYSMFLLEDYSNVLDAEGQRQLDTLHGLSQKMQELLENLFEYSKLAYVELAVEETDLNALVEDVLFSLRPRLEEQKVAVRIERPLPTILCDRVRVREVWANLISNAAKYNDKLQRWIEIGWEGDENAPTFYVRDNGIGIDRKHFEYIFKLFRRVYPSDEWGGGTGAGLSIAQRIVERSGGRIRVESVVDEGSTFWFTLPRGERTAPAVFIRPELTE